MSVSTPLFAPQPPSGGYTWRADRSRAGLTHKNELERVTALARSIGQAAVEILGGTRPASQLARWTTQEVVDRFEQRAAMLKLVQEQYRDRSALFEIHRAPRVRRIRVYSPAPQCYEAALVIEESVRSRAVALRIENVNRQWRVVHLEVG